MGIKQYVKITFCIGIVVFVFTTLQKDRLPGKSKILQQLYQEPLQTDTQAEPFTLTTKGTEYRIFPLYNYELYGLVVSYHHSNVFWDYYHEANNDFINTADICVIWGKNIETEIYKKMKFSSESWTCYTQWTNQDDYSKFCAHCLSNNHLLAQSSAINRKIMQAQKGDQIYMKGYLVNYTQKDWQSSQRTSSVTRSDTKCEVVFVKEFEILGRNNYPLRVLHKLSKYLMFACIGFFLVEFFQRISKDINDAE